MSTSFCSARRLAAPDGRTSKPMMMAFDADARLTSLSEMAPTALCITLTWMFGVESLMSESLRASTDPSTSAFTIRLSSWKSPILIRRPSSSRVSVCAVRTPCSRCSCSRFPVISRASRSLSTTWKLTPAWGAPLRPRISTGSAGAADFIFWLRSLNIAFTLPHDVPAITMSPILRVPFDTSTVAT